ncbi:MAG: hypothetical protein IJZ78_06135, partial [Alistipes sp.]|nr:hypothetical protein [Alistipes sp.]
ASSSAANKLSCQWAVRQSTAHRLEICRVLYLMPSPNKYARPQNAHLRKVNSAFSGIAGLKLHLFIQPHNKTGMTNLLFSHPPLVVVRLSW